MIDYGRKDLARILKVDDVVKHENADRLDVATIKGWECIIGRDTMKAGDLCVYFEIDSILSEDLEQKIFGPNSKIKLSKSRVKTIKIRGQFSQGLAIPIKVIFEDCLPKRMKHGHDATKELKVGKYVPTPKEKSILYVQKMKKIHENPNFHKMRKPIHYNRAGGFNTDVVITEKIHGTSMIAGWIERPTETFLEKMNAKFFGKYNFCYRSMNVQLQGKDSFYVNLLKKLKLKKEVSMESTLYGRMCIKYDLKNKLKDGDEVTGEAYGSGIQKNYSYGCDEGEQKLIVFGFRHNGKELDPLYAKVISKTIGLDFVPVLFIGQMPDKEDIERYSVGPSVLDHKTKVREGCVINSADGSLNNMGAALVKSINPEYLLKDQSEFN